MPVGCGRGGEGPCDARSAQAPQHVPVVRDVFRVVEVDEAELPHPSVGGHRDDDEEGAGEEDPVPLRRGGRDSMALARSRTHGPRSLWSEDNYSPLGCAAMDADPALLSSMADRVQHLSSHLRM